MLINIVLGFGMLAVVTIILIFWARDRDKNESRELQENVRKHLDRTS